MKYHITAYSTDSLLAFGRHSGKTLEEIVNEGEIEYIDWCLKNLDHFALTLEAAQELLELSERHNWPSDVWAVINEKTKKIEYYRPRQEFEEEDFDDGDSSFYDYVPTPWTYGCRDEDPNDMMYEWDI